jgi:hypothetical protein
MILLPVRTFEKKPARIPLSQLQGLQNTTCQWLQRRDCDFYWAGIHVLVQRWKKTIDKDADCIEK